MRSLLAAATLALLAGTAVADKVSVGYIELDDPIQERAKNEGFGGVATGLTMRDLVKAFDHAANDPSIKAVVIRVKDCELSRANVDELGKVIDGFRKSSGKKVHLFSENFDTKELLLGAHCDEVIAQKGTGVSLPGIYMEEMFLADTFKWIGVQPDFVQIGDYKGAQEMYANSKPSPQWDQNINALLDSMYAHVRAELKAGRKLSDEQLDKALNEAWMAFAEDAKKNGLIDSVVDFADLERHLAKQYGGDGLDWDGSLLPDHKEQMKKVMSGGPFAVMSNLFKETDHSPRRDTVAVVHVDGAIVDGDSTGGGLFGGEGSVGSRTIRRALGELEDNDKVKGVVLRIDSPGGSAIASEVIWQGVKRLGEKKPVWVSVGDMAASGGYYIAVSGQKIYVNPNSIVGSIGVVGGKMALAGVYDKLHINVVQRSRGPRASMMNGSLNPWTSEEKALVRAKMTETYDLFTSRVTAGRKGIDLAKTAEGRLFTGDKAIELKMADKLGTLDDAVTDLASSLSLGKGEYDVMDYPAPKSFAETIEDMFGGFGASAPHVSGALSFRGPLAEVATLAKGLVGEANYRQLLTSMDAMAQLRKEPVILTTPSVLIFK